MRFVKASCISIDCDPHRGGLAFVLYNDILKGVREALIGIGLNTRNVTPKRSKKVCLENGEIFLPEYMMEEENSFHSMPKLDLLPTLAVSRNVALSIHTDT